jgi:hypothetical protein
VVLVGPQTVMEGGRAILGYLLHQAAHGGNNRFKSDGYLQPY